MIKRLLLLLLFPAVTLAQGVIVNPKTVLGTTSGVTRPIPAATITVCAAGAVGVPCAPALAGVLFKDAALTQPLSNPFPADANGNYQFAIAGGTYTITESASGFSGYSYQLTVSCAPGICSVTSLTTTGNVTVGGNLSVVGSFNPSSIAISGPATFTGATTVSSLNGAIVVDGVTYARTNAGIQSAVNATPSGGTVFLPTGTYALTSAGSEQILINKPLNFICAGWGSLLQVSSSVGSTPAIHIVASGITSGVRIQDCSIIPQTTGHGSYAIQADVASGQDILKLIIEHNQIGLMDSNVFNGFSALQFSNGGIFLNGTGFLGDIEIEHNFIAGGIFGSAIGDSITIGKNLIEGNVMVGQALIDATFLAGSSSFRVQDNTIIPAAKGAIHLGAGTTFPIIVGNEVETVNNTSVGSNGAVIDIDGLWMPSSISSISVTSNVVTLVTSSNFPVNTAPGTQVYTTGVTNAAYNGGPFTIVTFNGTNTITYNETLSQAASSGGNVGFPATGADLEKNQCQVVTASTLNCMRFNYSQNQVVRDNNFILPTSPGVDILLTTKSSGGIIHANNFNGVTFAQAITDNSGIGSTLYDNIGGQSRPDVPLIGRDSSGAVSIYAGGSNNQLLAFSGGASGNSFFDGATNSTVLTTASSPSSAPAASTFASVRNFAFTEATAPGATTAFDICYGDSTAHAVECSYNNGTFGIVPLVNRANTFTAAQTLGAGSSLNATSLLVSPTAPTIAGAGCGGTVAAIQNANGTASFEIFTGTAPTSAGCTVTFPAATHHWICPTITHTSAVSTTNFIILQTGALSSTSVTFQIFSDVAAAIAPTASDTWAVSGCHAN